MVTWRHYGQEEKKSTRGAFVDIVNSKIYDLDYKKVDDFYEYKMRIHSAIKFYTHFLNSINYKKSREDIFCVMMNYISQYDFFAQDFLNSLYEKFLYTAKNSRLNEIGDDNDYCDESSENIEYWMNVIRYICCRFGKDIHILDYRDIAFLKEEIYDKYLHDSYYIKQCSEEELNKLRHIFKDETNLIHDFNLNYNKNYLQDDAIIEIDNAIDYLYDGMQMIAIAIENINVSGYMVNTFFRALQSGCATGTEDVVYDKENKVLKIIMSLNTFVECNECSYILVMMCMMLLDYGWCNLLEIR